MRRLGLLAVTLGVLIGTLAASTSADTLPGHYIVVLKDSVSKPGAVAKQHGLEYGVDPSQIYTHALDGYAGTIPQQALVAVRSDPRVAYVTADSEVSAYKKLHPAPTPGPQPSQTVPTGVDRIDGDQSTAASGNGTGAVGVNIAVLDTGISSVHPDLNIVGGVNCANGKLGSDDRDGHGTHVAGIAAAKDNGIGVVGIAPGAQLWAVRVLNDAGTGQISNVLCGIDFVTSTRTDSDPANDIAVANMSLGGRAEDDDQNCGYSSTDPEHQAICASVAAGVTYVVSAGNDSEDFQFTRPALYDEVLTVTAVADYDGASGALSSPTCTDGGADDGPAIFSNFATLASDQAHTTAAPGVCINSTYPYRIYTDKSGTSMAAPHVTGIIALCISTGECAGLTPLQIIDKIVADAAAYNTANPSYGFTGDPLHSPDPGKYYGYLVRAGLY